MERIDWNKPVEVVEHGDLLATITREGDRYTVTNHDATLFLRASGIVFSCFLPLLKVLFTLFSDIFPPFFLKLFCSVNIIFIKCNLFFIDVTKNSAHARWP